MSGKRYLIVNADDFGASPGVSRGILDAHSRGIVTSTSMMVDAPGSEAAADLARLAPGLSIGLHVDLAPAFAGAAGDAAGLEAELRRQAARFVAFMGVAPTHLDSHRDVHRNPEILPAFLELARSLRVPLRGHSATRRLGDFYGQWGGESHPEQVGVASLVRMLESKLGDGITELICHPGYVDEQLRSSYVQEREVEVATLCDARVREALSRLDIDLVSHVDLGRLVGGLT